MVPKIIEDPVFVNRKEISGEIVKDLIFEGGVLKVKELLTNKWKVNPDEVIAVPSLNINTAGKVGGAKWYVVGKLGKDVNMKLTQLSTEAADDVVLCIQNLEFDIFPFYNKRRNVSGWIDSQEVEFKLLRKVKSKKVQVPPEDFEDVGFQGFSLRIGILPVTAKAASLVLAIHPLSKDDLKAKLPDAYYKNGCPQVALAIGDNNCKYLNVNLAVQEPRNAEIGMGVLPLLEDLRSQDEIANLFPNSWDIRVATNSFLRSSKGFNSKTAKKVMEAMDDMDTEMSRSFEPEFLWPEHASSEGEEPVEDLGKWQ